MKLTKPYLRKLVQEELNSSSLNESIKIKLPTHYYISTWGDKTYSLDYKRVGYEPSVAQVGNTATLLKKLYSAIASKIKVKQPQEPFIRSSNDDVTIGIKFTSDYGIDELENIFSTHIGIR